MNDIWRVLIAMGMLGAWALPLGWGRRYHLSPTPSRAALSGWMILWLASWGWLSAVATLLLQATGWAVGAAAWQKEGLLVGGLTLALGGSLAGLAWAGRVNPAPWVGWGVGPLTLPDTLVGIVLGGVGVSVYAAVGYIGGWNHWVPAEVAPKGEIWLATVGLMAMVAVLEEGTSRGCLLQLGSRIVGVPVALIGSTAVFTLLHSANPGVTPLALLGVAQAGLLLAWAVRLRGSLWLAMGIHAGWNSAETLGYGYANSGHPALSPLILWSDPTVPDWLTGGEFGPEASVWTPLALAVMLFGLYVWQRLRPPTTPIRNPQSDPAGIC